MAQRFGGRFSPGGNPPETFEGKRPTRAGFRSNLLFVLPFLFAVRAFTGSPEGLILGLGAFALTLFGAFLTREGLLAHEAYDARKVARRPAFPRKILGAVATGAGLLSASLMAGQPLAIGGLIGILGAGLQIAAFGLDPLRDKGASEVDRYQSDRVARAVEEAERTLAEMKAAILRANDRSLTDRVDRFAATARRMFRTVEEDPGDLTAARKYLSVYLSGARDATVKFADLQGRRADPQAREDYAALLTDLDTNFATRTEALLTDDRTDLDVEISVLRDRLKVER